MRCPEIMFSRRFLVYLSIVMVSLVYTNSAPIPYNSVVETIRVKRQIDLTLSAEHDDKEDDTELALEAIANLYRSEDGKTQIDGSARVVHRSNSFQNGNNRYSGSIHIHHDYRKRK